MSVQFGRWNFEGQSPAPDYIAKVDMFLAPYGPDSDNVYSNGGITIVYRAFNTTNESRRETQPHICPSGAIITWDGRLDDRAELISEVRTSLTNSSTDVEIVAAAYEKWGTNCFAKLVGDWAVSISNLTNRWLILAKDSIGTRHLYYSIERNQITWSTILDPLILFPGKTFAICEEYIAGWFSYFPAAHLTPYVGVHAVPPSSFVLLQPGKHTVNKYWDFDPAKQIRYRSDTEYEEHFRIALATAVQRRLRSDRPVLAELSGGMDSSSIVCMADIVIARGTADTPRLDTISWYDDDNPDMDERPYFTKVEQRRGRSGCHFDFGLLKEKDVTLQKSFDPRFEDDRFAVTPRANRGLSGLFKWYAAYMKAQGHRVTLSGIGGDEVTGGGVPTPNMELQNLMARARFSTLAHQLNAWAMKMRKPRLPLLREAVWDFFFRSITGVPKNMHPAPWLRPGFVRRNHAALRAYPYRVKLFGPLPSFQANIVMLDVLRRLLADGFLQLTLLREVRLPYLDRDLLEFLYAIPRQQIVGVGRRRYLMKRALAGIVPDELLNRKRKTFVSQETSKDTSTEWPSLVENGEYPISASLGIVDPNLCFEALQRARRNEEVSVDFLMRTLTLESWLRHLMIHGVLTNSMSTKRPDISLPFDAKKNRASVQPESSVS